MFSSKCNYTKLKTNLRLAVNRLKLLEKKNTELALKARKEIADYIQSGKEDRARIRVEHIVREDYMVEAMEILEMFCDLLLARFGIIERVSALDPTIEEAVASIIWAEPRLSADVPELTVISKNLSARYGKEYNEACRSNTLNNVNVKLMNKMNIYSPPKQLIENYMVEIAKSFNVEFSPDPLVLMGEIVSNDLIDVSESKPRGGPPPPPDQPPSGGTGGYPTHGGHSYPPPPPGGHSHPPPPPGTGGYPPPSGGYPTSGAGYPPPGLGYPLPGSGGFPPPTGVSGGYPSGAPPASQVNNRAFNYSPATPSAFDYPTKNPGGIPGPPVYDVLERPDNPPTYSALDLKDPKEQNKPGNCNASDDISFPEIPNDEFNLPSVPNSTRPGGPAGPPPNNDIDFDDLAARFENLKKKK